MVDLLLYRHNKSFFLLLIDLNDDDDDRSDDASYLVHLLSSRLIKMTVVHDLAECIVGDITPHCNVSREEKLRREAVSRSAFDNCLFSSCC